MYPVTSVKIQGDYILDLTFDDGSRKFFDVSPYFDKDNFSELADPLYFKRVTLLQGTVHWPNGQNFMPDTLFAEGIALPDDRARIYHRWAFWIPFLSLSFLGVGFAFFVLIGIGMHHSSSATPSNSERFLEVVYPLVPLLKPFVSEQIEAFLLVLFTSVLGQFPLYGYVLGYANVNRDSQRGLTAAGFVMVHLLVMFLYGLYLSSP